MDSLVTFQRAQHYLKAPATEEGFATPFARIKDIEINMGEKLTLVSEVGMPGSQVVFCSSPQKRT